MQLDDKIVLAFGGPIGAGKKIIAEACEDYASYLLRSLSGNLWVPKEVNIVKESLDKDLFKKYSNDRGAYASQFQFSCLAAREETQSKVENSHGIVILRQNYEADREVYAEANKSVMGENFAIYDKLHQQISPRSLQPDIHIYCKVTDVNYLKKSIAARKRPEEKWLLSHVTYLHDIIKLNENFYERKRDMGVPVLEIDCANELDSDFLLNCIYEIEESIKTYKKPLRLDLEVWNKLEFIQAMQGKREAQRQLVDYLGKVQKIMTIAGNVATGKTTFAEFLAGELNINIAYELSGKNDHIQDELLSKFLMDKPRYCYDLQEYLIPKRKSIFMDGVSKGKSFVSDRSAGEDAFIFHRRFEEQGFLTRDQKSKLLMHTIAEYEDVPQADLLVKLMASSQHSRRMVLERGRLEEMRAWPEAELAELAKFYEDIEDQFSKHNLHNGPSVSFNVEKINIKNAVHQGFVFQEILLALLNNSS
tara:strand:+ start:9938 stop:11365 length:1428 start_codon:yes stop_codon:yes gene_type:complete